jgi:hypothetical protein
MVLRYDALSGLDWPIEAKRLTPLGDAFKKASKAKTKGAPSTGLVASGRICPISIQNCPILRIEWHSPCNNGLLAVHENVPVY